jgi:hypothetical protein
MTVLMWTCTCDTVNPILKRSCRSCGASKPRMVSVPATSALPRTTWVPRGPRPCTDAENAGALAIVIAVLEKKMTMVEAEDHLHNIFKGRELP